MKSHVKAVVTDQKAVCKPNVSLLYHQRQISFCKGNQDVQHWSGSNNNNGIFREFTYNTLNFILQPADT